MRKFLFNLLSFSLILLFVIAILISFKPLLYKKYSFKIPENQHVLFMGTSMLETSINDSLIECARNLSMSGEPHLYTYLKLKYLIRDNVQIDTVFLGLGPGNLCECADFRYFTPNQAPVNLSLYYPLFSLQEFLTLFERAPLDYLDYMSKSLGRDYYSSGEEYVKNFGSFKKSLKIYDPNEKDDPPRVFGEEGNIINISYLEKINDLCIRNNIKLYYIFAPMCKANKDMISKEFYKVYHSQFSEIPLLDYSDWNLPDSCRKDPYHLNYYGSILFTKEIKRRFNLK